VHNVVLTLIGRENREVGRTLLNMAGHVLNPLRASIDMPRGRVSKLFPVRYQLRMMIRFRILK
jgi:hypothetical protein